jgi:cysteine synthase A
LVSPVGSGGSSGGLAQALRTGNGPPHLVGVDTHGSVIFGLPNGPRLLRGLGSSIHLRNVRHTAYDEVHWVSAAEAFQATRRHYREYGLFMGPTSGASFLAAEWWAARHPDAKVLMVLPDGGHRYQRSVYNDEWLAEHDVQSVLDRTEPALVQRPSEVMDTWSRMMWGRRTLAAVLGPEVGR